MEDLEVLEYFDALFPKEKVSLWEKYNLTVTHVVKRMKRMRYISGIRIPDYLLEEEELMSEAKRIFFANQYPIKNAADKKYVSPKRVIYLSIYYGLLRYIMSQGPIFKINPDACRALQKKINDGEKGIGILRDGDGAEVEGEGFQIEGIEDESVVHYNEDYEWLHGVIDALGEDEKFVVEKVFLEGKTYREVGELLGEKKGRIAFPRQRIEQIKNKAMKSLKSKIKLLKQRESTN